MIIDKHLLLSHGGEVKQYTRGECIFLEGTVPKYYFQILNGTAKISSVNNDAREFVHGFPFDGYCFGESYLFTDKNYAISAFAETKCTVLQVPRNNLTEIFYCIQKFGCF
jgi:CRP-like cAMP-binding protein